MSCRGILEGLWSGPGRLHFVVDLAYTRVTEVIHMTQRAFARHTSTRYAALAVLVLVLVALGLGSLGVAYGQQESAVERYYRLLSRISDAALLKLPGAMADLANPDGASLTAFLDNPRTYLEQRQISLPVNYYQVVALNFDYNLPPEKKWFGVAAQQDSKTYVAAGIGLFYDNVGIFIQAAADAPAAAAGAPLPVLDFLPASSGSSQAIDSVGSYLQLIERIPADALKQLPAVMEELNAAKADDPIRTEFVTNPRDYLLKRDILLRSSDYRIVAMDFQKRAATLDFPAVVVGKPRGGLAVVPEGIGFFYAAGGVFIQEAI